MSLKPILATAQPGCCLLEVTSLRAGYGAIEVLRGIDISVSAGQIVAILGSNGAGKSTLNNNISGLYQPFGGSICFDGQDITGAPATRIIDAGIVQVPEGRRVFPTLSVVENLELGSYRRGRAARARNLERIFEIFPRLRERRKQIAGTLSGGEQQMLAIGRALMSEPRLLILDEPSLGLSPLLVEEMFSLIVSLNRDGLTIMLVEQNVVQSLSIAHHAFVLENGRIAFSDKSSALTRNPSLRRSYLGT